MNIFLRKLKNLGHLFEATIANIYYGFPSRKLKVIGITGTDGKTTTTHLIYHILKSAGRRASMISSVYAKIGSEEHDTGLHTTTPSAFFVQKFLKQSVSDGDEFFVLETTAHGLDQARVWGTRYYLSLLTNVTHEHLRSEEGYDYFDNYDNYLQVKTRLLLASKIALINRDDQSFEKVKKILNDKKKNFFTYSLKTKASYNWDNKIQTKIPGEMNRYNILAAYSVSRLLGIEEKEILKAIETFNLPLGRLDIVYDKKIKVIIDFAHTINGLQQILKTLKEEILKEGRIIHVFGSAGLRDKTKRPSMGKASGQYADLVILTEEDYRTEDLYKICEQIAEGLKKQDFTYIDPKLFEQKDKKNYTIIPNRADAIKKALSTAKEGDIVVLTGKGHEKSLCRGKKEDPWDEKKEVLNFFSKT